MAERIVLLCRPPEGADLPSSSLAGLGWSVELAEDGYRAVELTERLHASVIVVSTDLPGPLLTDVLRRLRSTESERRVLLVLHEPDPELAAELIRAGADGVLDPGPTPEDVARAVEQVASDGCVLGPKVARELAARFSTSLQRELEWSRSLADLAGHAEVLSSAKAEFLSNVSHELRTPLTIIKGVAQVVGKFGGGDRQQQTMLSQLEEAATKLTRMVENLLILAEMERGEFKLEIADCDLAQVVRDGTEEASARYPNVEVTMMVPRSMPAHADAERIREVVRHLVDNACRYSEEGGAVTVQAKAATEGVVVTVTDRGEGLDRKVMSAAFGEAFSPGEQVLTKDRAGLGLGLNLARNLVTQHGGILSAEPLPGGGTKVSFVLPPEPVRAKEEEQVTAAEDEPAGDPLELLRNLQQKLADSEARA